MLQKEAKEANILVNKYMLEYGFAKYFKNENTMHQNALVQAENSARAKDLGLWKNCPGEKSESEIESGRRTENSVGPTNFCSELAAQKAGFLPTVDCK